MAIMAVGVVYRRSAGLLNSWAFEMALKIRVAAAAAVCNFESLTAAVNASS